MKKRLQGFAAGVIATLMLTGVFAVAKNMYEKIDVLYNDIKIEIDGESFIATNANGDIVEPFIYEGTTYLPVRAIATAFDKDVAWDEETFTVSLTSKKDEAETVPTEKNENENLAEYDKNLLDKDLLGTWQGNVSGMLVNSGIPEEIAKKHDIFITYEFGEDGTYKTYMTEESVNSLVNASFEYALLAYGVTAEQFPQVYGVSVEEIKDQLKAEIDLNDFVEEGKCRVENGVLYFSVEGVPEEAVNYLFDEGKLTLFVDGISIDLEKIAVNE